MRITQSTNRLLLVEPAEFYANPQTMDTNVYQKNDRVPEATLSAQALVEFRNFRDMLVSKNIAVTTLRGVPGCPDHLFPNWISTHADKKMIIYPMMNRNRRAEKTPEILNFFRQYYDVWYDYTEYEYRRQFLESTGSLWMDRVNSVAYAGLSARTTEQLAQKWAKDTGYDLITFRTHSHTSQPVYHTDLMMHIGTKMAAVCIDCIVEEDQQKVLSHLHKTHDVVELSMNQLQAFCGNSLEVMTLDNKRVIVMSETAYQSLGTTEQFYRKYYDDIIYAPIPTIEKYGGGSARCLIMELF